jgi:plasmid stabilization system protein ParE
VTRKLIIAPAARDDVDEIWEFISRDSIDAADRVRDEIEQASSSLPKYQASDTIDAM